MAQKKKKINASNKTVQAHSGKGSEPFSNKLSSVRFNFKAILPLIIAILFFLTFWLTPVTNFRDPWNLAGQKLLDAVQILNTEKGQKLFEESGNELRFYASKYPFHARIHYYLGHYYSKKKMWDSAIYEEKLAAKIDSGSETNQVYASALEIASYCLTNKYVEELPIKGDIAVIAYLRDAYDCCHSNSSLPLELGNYYKKYLNYDSAYYYYTKYLLMKPDDMSVFNDYGLILIELKKYDEAIAVYNNILAKMPDNQMARQNLAFLKSRKDSGK